MPPSFMNIGLVRFAGKTKQNQETKKTKRLLPKHNLDKGNVAAHNAVTVTTALSFHFRGEDALPGHGV